MAGSSVGTRVSDRRSRASKDVPLHSRERIWCQKGTVSGRIAAAGPGLKRCRKSPSVMEGLEVSFPGDVKCITGRSHIGDSVPYAARTR